MLSVRSYLMMERKLLILAACVALAASRAVEESPGRQSANVPKLYREPKEVLYKLDQPLALKCGIFSDAKGDLKFSWTKNDKPVVLNENVIIPGHLKDRLIILQTSVDTEGVYQCFMTSEAGTASANPIKVKRTFIDIPKLETKSLKPVEGDPFELRCPEVNAYPKPNLTWVYQHSYDTSISHTILDPRITLGPNGVLYFSNVTDEDVNKNFKYVCLAKNQAYDEPVPLAEYYFNELEARKSDKFAPRVPQYVSGDVTGIEGQTTALYCIYGGTPLIPPDWFFNGKLITASGADRVTDHNRSKGKRLLIRYTEFSDQGEYSCKITEPDGKATTSAMKLTVVSVPRFVKRPDFVVNAKESADVTLPCEVTGIPDQIIWTYNGKPFNEGDFTITKDLKNNENGGATFTAFLNLKKVKKASKGYYGCKATHGNNVIYTEAFLSVS